MENHYKIIEQGQEYILGKNNKNNIQYNFDKTLTYLEAKGKLLYSQDFKIYNEDKFIIYKLLIYMIKDKENCRVHHIDLSKGILLTGPIGRGKTSLMNLIKYIIPNNNSYIMKSSRVISFEYLKQGH